MRDLLINLKRLRKINVLSQEALALKAGLSRNAYRSIESGKSQPKVINLQKIALALNTSLSELLNPVPKLTSLRFRCKKGASERVGSLRDQSIADFAKWLKNYNDLENLLNECPSFKLQKLSSSSDPIHMAKLAREALGLKDDEVINDICALLEAAGLKIFVLDSVDSEVFFGFSLSSNDGGPAIAVNTSEKLSVERKIFTAAHELAHILLHPKSFSSSKKDENGREETEADLFASYFLMPQLALEKKMQENRGRHWIDIVLHIKRHFRVSYKTVLYRLSQTGKVEGNIWLKFNMAYKSRYNDNLKGHREPAPIENEFKAEPRALDAVEFMEDRLNRLVRDAYEKELITFNRAAEILNISVTEMRELAGSWFVMK